jgi:hypothetical protein
LADHPNAKQCKSDIGPSEWAAIATFVLVGGLIGWVLHQATGNASVFSKEGFIDAFVGAIVGGAFAILGGLAGAAYSGRVERIQQREQRRGDLIGSSVLTYTELAHNIGLLALFAGSERSVQLPINISVSTLPQVQTVLARGLPILLLVQIRAAYGVLEAAQALVLRGRSAGGLNAKERETLARIAGQAKQAQDALQEHLKKEFGYIIPEGSEKEVADLSVHAG